jgi:hypothetical protein
LKKVTILRLEVHLVDGSLMDIPESNPDRFFVKLERLKAQGLEGKELVNKLITDDWGAPPISVVVKGRMEDGEVFSFTLPYD